MKKGFSWLYFSVLALALAGCGGGGGGGGGSANLDPGLLFISASPDSAKMTWAVEGKTKTPPQGYLQTSGIFQSVKPGDLDVELFEQGNPETTDARVITFSSNENSLLLGCGFKDFGTEFDKRLRIHRFLVNRSVPNGNRARVYFFHALLFEAGFFLPNLTVQSPGKTPQYVSEDMAFGVQSELGMDAGEQSIVVRRSGTEKNYLETKINLVSGKVYLALITGVVGRAGVDKAQVKLIELPTQN